MESEKRVVPCFEIKWEVCVDMKTPDLSALEDQGGFKGSSGMESSQWLDSSYSWHSVDSDNRLSSHVEADMLTIEGLRRHYNSCSACGVSWYSSHVTLDCHECGGYAMYRPCPDCDGQCDNVWRRDTEGSHQSKKAQWIGECKQQSNCLSSTTQVPVSIPQGTETNNNSL